MGGGRSSLTQPQNTMVTSNRLSRPACSWIVRLPELGPIFAPSHPPPAQLPPTHLHLHICAYWQVICPEQAWPKGQRSLVMLLLQSAVQMHLPALRSQAQGQAGRPAKRYAEGQVFPKRSKLPEGGEGWGGGGQSVH